MKIPMLRAVAVGVTLSVAAIAPAVWAADCGDTAGPSGERVPCACGDSVVTSTTLKATDPVVSTDPGDFCAGLALSIFTADVKLDCKGLALRGDFTDDGIYIDAEGVTVQGCVVTEFYPYGIHVDAGAATLVLNKTFLNGYGGIAFHFGSGSHAERNQTEGNGCHGIELDFDTTGNTITQNRSYDNGCEGIHIYPGSGGNVVGLNLTDNNELEGIRVESTGNTLDGNRGKGNGFAWDYSGILVENTGNTLIRNVYDSNAGYGICVVPGNTDAGGNRGTGNGFTPDVNFAC